jgi:sphingomyelin phosphodiesterase 2
MSSTDADTETHINLFTLNCWQVHLCTELVQNSDNQLRGLKYVSKHRSERIRAIAQFLEDAPFDIVTLQELWVYADYDIVRSRISQYLPFSKFFYRCIPAYNNSELYTPNEFDHSGALGAGLAIFSRFPIVAATIHPYSLNGSPIDVVAGDWFVGKSATSVLITHPTLGQVQIFNTHVCIQLVSLAISSLKRQLALC